jgi:hypothetical protein
VRFELGVRVMWAVGGWGVGVGRRLNFVSVFDSKFFLLLEFFVLFPGSRDL